LVAALVADRNLQPQAQTALFLNNRQRYERLAEQKHCCDGEARKQHRSCRYSHTALSKLRLSAVKVLPEPAQRADAQRGRRHAGRPRQAQQAGRCVG
jgi:hypothetical protein